MGKRNVSYIHDWKVKFMQYRLHQNNDAVYLNNHVWNIFANIWTIPMVVDLGLCVAEDEHHIIPTYWDG